MARNARQRDMSLYLSSKDWGRFFLNQEVQSLIKSCLDDLDQTGLTDSPEPDDRPA